MLVYSAMMMKEFSFVFTHRQGQRNIAPAIFRGGKFTPGLQAFFVGATLSKDSMVLAKERFSLRTSIGNFQGADRAMGIDDLSISGFLTFSPRFFSISICRR